MVAGMLHALSDPALDEMLASVSRSFPAARQA